MLVSYIVLNTFICLKYLQPTFRSSAAQQRSLEIAKKLIRGLIVNAEGTGTFVRESEMFEIAHIRDSEY